ncbi:putative B3 domain-containing protein At5g58280 [Abrus precatorius]|uniref:B3 domain-containing protein At5g58280 n=1 Tax=Abrus precatorius TaxID=3816 RepID=A0A8B8MIR4_ABRPR|nr:putative B3 domain-containing protein At5g58280 [Abrus precatorius]
MAKGRTNNKYEEARKQRLEENKRRFEHHLRKLKSKINGVVEPRRSSRVRNPICSYHEDGSINLPPLRKRSRSNSSSWGSYAARPLDEIKEATKEERVCALEAAEALQNNLKSSNPSFVKSMVRSHVYSCFWLGLPSKFCEEHLPKTVYDMILEDENGSEYEAIYIGKRCGLSGGWRAFALDHKLDDGDALVFELIEAARFKLTFDDLNQFNGPPSLQPSQQGATASCPTIYIVRAFSDSVEEEEGKDILEEEGNMHATKTPKTASNRESRSNKTKKRKQAIVYETKESESAQERLPESRTDKEVKPRGVNPTKKTKSKLSATAESKGEAQNKAEKPKASVKLSNKTRKSKEGKKNGFIQEADSKLEKVEPIEKGSKSVSQKPIKKPAPKCNIEKFDGMINFGLWQKQVKDVLIQSGLHKAWKGKTSNTKEEKWEELDLRVASAIRLCLAKNVLTNVQKMSTAKELWEKLEGLYQAKSISN